MFMLTCSLAVFLRAAEATDQWYVISRAVGPDCVGLKSPVDIATGPPVACPVRFRVWGLGGARLLRVWAWISRLEQGVGAAIAGFF